MNLTNSLKWLAVPALLAMVILTGCTTAVAQGQGEATGQKTQIEEVVWAVEEAFATGDVETLISFYADDVVSLPPGYPKTEGKEALRTDLEAFFDAFTIEREFELVNIDVSGKMATRLGEWTQTLIPKDGGDPFVETGRCILGFEKQNGEWKVVWEIWNTYGPMP